MSNKYIEVVKKWLADNDSVSREELTANAAAAGDAWYDALNAAKAADEAYEAATDAVNSAAYHDACDAACDAACTQLHNHDAAHRVKRYEELTLEPDVGDTCQHCDAPITNGGTWGLCPKCAEIEFGDAEDNPFIHQPSDKKPVTPQSFDGPEHPDYLKPLVDCERFGAKDEGE